MPFSIDVDDYAFESLSVLSQMEELLEAAHTYKYTYVQDWFGSVQRADKMKPSYKLLFKRREEKR